MNYRSIFKQNKLPLLLIALAFPVSVTTSSLYATTTEVTITQQKKAINGVVFDGGLNEPLIGANVVVKGTTNGTVTDLDAPPYLLLSEPGKASAIPGEKWMCQYRLPARYGQ